MKRAVVAAVVVIVAIGAVGLWQPWESVTAQDDRVIPVHFLSYVDVSGAIGDPCGDILDEWRFFTTPQQLVIEDEMGAVVAVHALTGTVEEDDNGRMRCNGDFAITVPDAAFYTVRLGDERIRTYAANEFPINPADAVFVSSH